MENKKNGLADFRKDHWEKDIPKTEVANGKYGSEFGNPEDLKRSVDALARYAKKNRMKY